MSWQQWCEIEMRASRIITSGASHRREAASAPREERLTDPNPISKRSQGEKHVGSLQKSHIYKNQAEPCVCSWNKTQLKGKYTGPLQDPCQPSTVV